MKQHKNIIHVNSKAAPIVELDSACRAAYLRFSKEPVKKTVVVDVVGSVVTMDLDVQGHVVGVELVGVLDFRVDTLLRKAGIRGVSPAMLRNTRYVPATLQPT